MAVKSNLETLVLVFNPKAVMFDIKRESDVKDYEVVVYRFKKNDDVPLTLWKMIMSLSRLRDDICNSQYQSKNCEVPSPVVVDSKYYKRIIDFYRRKLVDCKEKQHGKSEIRMWRG